MKKIFELVEVKGLESNLPKLNDWYIVKIKTGTYKKLWLEKHNKSYWLNFVDSYYQPVEVSLSPSPEPKEVDKATQYRTPSQPQGAGVWVKEMEKEIEAYKQFIEAAEHTGDIQQEWYYKGKNMAYANVKKWLSKSPTPSGERLYTREEMEKCYSAGITIAQYEWPDNKIVTLTKEHFPIFLEYLSTLTANK